MSERKLKYFYTSVGQSERNIETTWTGGQQSNLKNKLDEMRRKKERQNKFDRKERDKRLESIKKLRSESRGATGNLVGFRKVVCEFQNLNLRSFSRKVRIGNC